MGISKERAIAVINIIMSAVYTSSYSFYSLWNFFLCFVSQPTQENKVRLYWITIYWRWPFVYKWEREREIFLFLLLMRKYRRFEISNRKKNVLDIVSLFFMIFVSKYNYYDVNMNLTKIFLSYTMIVYWMIARGI